MLRAAEHAGLRYILNVILDSHKRIIHAVAGDFRQAHEAGCRHLEQLCSIDAAPANIVITTNGGYPLDQNIYQAVKGLTAAEATVNPGGVIIKRASPRAVLSTSSPSSTSDPGFYTVGSGVPEPTVLFPAFSSVFSAFHRSFLRNFRKTKLLSRGQDVRAFA